MDELIMYLRDENILLSKNFANRSFRTKQEIDVIMTQCYAFWNKHVKKRCYMVVDYNGVSVAPELNGYFGKKRKDIEALALTIVRYASDQAVRASIRATSIKIHQASNLYATEEEALEVIRRIIAGQVTIST